MAWVLRLMVLCGLAGCTTCQQTPADESGASDPEADTDAEQEWNQKQEAEREAQKAESLGLGAAAELRGSALCAASYQQCGGATWAGVTCCKRGSTCTAQSDQYSQCIPDATEATTKAPATPRPSEDPVVDTGIKGRRPWDYFPKAKVHVTLKAVSKAANPVVVKGNFLYDAVTQKRFYVKGLCYNPNPQPYTHAGTTSCKPGKPDHGPYFWGTDLITDEKEFIWREDLKAIADLGVNVVRLYDVDPEASHAKFMNAAAELGVYVIIPLTRAKWGFMPAGMASPTCYTGTIEGYGEVGLNLLTSAKLIVKHFSQFDNTLFFTVGNEVETSHKNGYAALPCVKALTRDIHAFQDECARGMRRVPLMYAATDVGGTKRKLIADYMQCELDTSDTVVDSVDVHGLNVYSWCDYNYTDEDGNAAWDRSPYYEIQRDFHGQPKPLIFSEFDCHEGAFHTDCPYKGGRTWPQLEVMTKEMAEYLSGGLAFEYSMEDNEFGLVLKPGYLEGQDDLRLTESYFALQEAYTKHDIAPTWDGHWDDTTRCTWDPSTGPFASPETTDSKFPVVSKTRACPSGAALQELFQHQYEGKVRPTWHMLPPRPATTVTCPNYELAEMVLKENCCHTDCTKAAEPSGTATSGTDLTPTGEAASTTPAPAAPDVAPAVLPNDAPEDAPAPVPAVAPEPAPAPAPQPAETPEAPEDPDAGNDPAEEKNSGDGEDTGLAVLSAGPAVKASPAIDHWALTICQVNNFNASALDKDEEARVRTVLASVLAQIGRGDAERTAVTDLKGRPEAVSLVRVTAGGQVIDTMMVKGLVGIPPNKTVSDMGAALSLEGSKALIVRALRDLLPDSAAIGSQLSVSSVAVSKSGPEKFVQIDDAELAQEALPSSFPWWVSAVVAFAAAVCLGGVFVVCRPGAEKKRRKRTAMVEEATLNEAPPLLASVASPSSSSAAPSSPTAAPTPTVVVPSPAKYVAQAPAVYAAVQPWQVARGPLTASPVQQAGGYTMLQPESGRLLALPRHA